MSEFPLTSDASVEQATGLVASTFPEARAAWLGGSVAAGTATASSDLDITVLLTGAPAPFRESLHHKDIPVEFFVHTDESLALYPGKDRARRQPTLATLVSASIVLLDRDGSGRRLSDECAAEIAAGPASLVDIVDEVLNRCGGRLFGGYRVDG
ncbi:MAG: nucleotidyltransferase domain-containing protein [Actinomycetota bacterium]|nr:nucleotidyltransferase domain-containing protein [Actinomycetota bacterium]